MRFFKMTDICNEVTKTVSEYINKGYMVDMSNMNSSFSNRLGTVELYNPTTKKYTSIYMGVKYNDDCFAEDIITLAVCESDKDAKHRRNEEISNIRTFYPITDKSNYNKTIFENANVFVENEEYAKKCSGIRHSRMYRKYGAKWDMKEIKRYNPNVIINMVKQHKGCKSYKKSQIEKVVVEIENGKTVAYKVAMKNRPMYITIKRR